MLKQDETKKYVEICELLGDLLENMDPMVGTLTQKYIQCGAPVR